jgi:hypothetical protein
LFDGEAVQESETLLTLVTLNCVAAELLPDELDVPLEALLDGFVPELPEEGLIPELPLEDWLELEGEPVLAEAPDSVPFTRTWCPTSSFNLEVSPCS